MPRTLIMNGNAGLSNTISSSYRTFILTSLLPTLEKLEDEHAEGVALEIDG